MKQLTILFLLATVAACGPTEAEKSRESAKELVCKGQELSATFKKDDNIIQKANRLGMMAECEKAISAFNDPSLSCNAAKTVWGKFKLQVALRTDPKDYK